MRTLHIVLPMAGRGSRFASAGFTTPKPLIEVDGGPMFLKALSSLDNIKCPKRYTIIIREEHEQQYNLSGLLKDALPEVNIIATNDTPIGSAADALRAEKYLQDDEGVVVLDCDLWFSSSSYNEMVESALNTTEPSAGLLTFTANNPRYSYAQIDSSNRVIRTAEKQVISEHAITGAYFFSTAQLFADSINELVKEPLGENMPEYYLSLAYNIIIKRGIIVNAAYVDQFASFGTPEELKEYGSARN